MKHVLPLLALMLLSGIAHAQTLVGQEFYGNGRLKSTRFADGNAERVLIYFESGRVKEMGRYKDGRRDGEWKEFAENGSLLAKAEFVEGVRQGTWEFRDRTNSLIGRLRYENGALAKGEQYDPAGELIAQREY